MRMIKILTFMVAAASCSVYAQAEKSDVVPFWSGCVVARQFVGDQTIALERVCSNPNRPFSVFNTNQLGTRPDLAGVQGPNALREATLMFTGLRSLHALGDSRKATLWLHETGANSASSKYKYELTLNPVQEAVISMPSGISLGLRMDASNVPSPYPVNPVLNDQQAYPSGSAPYQSAYDGGGPL